MKKLNLIEAVLKFFGSILTICFVLALLSVNKDVKATHAAITNGKVENRSTPVFRRICLGGTNAGNYRKQDSECPEADCADRNVIYYSTL